MPASDLAIFSMVSVDDNFRLSIRYFTSGPGLMDCPFLDHSKKNGSEPSSTEHSIGMFDPSDRILFFSTSPSFGANYQVIQYKALIT